MSFDTTLRPDPFIGRSFGAYRLTERIADVRVGAAFVAEHRHLDRRVVVKLFQPAPPGTPGGGLPRVEARLRALSRTRHESLLPLVDVGEGDGGLVFVVLELQDEEALATLALRGQAALPWPQVRSLGRQIAGGMRWAAGQGVAPADLEPAQIFVAPGAAGRDPRARIDVVTLETLGLGERPPRGEAERMLAVGRALYLLLTGRAPGAGRPDAATNPPPSRLGLDLPSDAEALVMRALDPAPDKRWPDLGALHRALGGRDADIAAATVSGAPGGAWFASAEAAASPAVAATADDGVGSTTAAATAVERRAAAAFDDHDFDRFGGPGADFSGDFGPDLRDDADFDDQEGSFGAKRFFVRPSRRAMISAGVASSAALALLVIVVGARVGERESGAPPARAVAQVPGAGEPRAEVDAAVAASTSGLVPGTSASVVATGPPDDGVAPVAGPPPTVTTQTPAGPTAAPAAPSVPAPTGDLPAARATSHLAEIPARPSTGPPPARTDTMVGTPAPASAGAASPVARVRDAPVTPASPSVENEQALAPAGGPLPGRNGAASREAPGASPGDGARTPAHDVADGAPGAGQPAAPASTAAETAPSDAVAVTVSPSGRCAVSLGSKPLADVWIDGRRAGSSPLNDLPIACGTHEVVFTSRELGVERRISLTLHPGEMVKRVVDLETSSASLAAGEGEVSPVPAPVVGRPARSECRLSLGSRPWAEVWIDGRRAGVTPLVSLPVRCGKHDLLFFSREKNVEHRETIVVPEGQSVKKVITLVEGE